MNDNLWNFKENSLSPLKTLANATKHNPVTDTFFGESTNSPGNSSNGVPDSAPSAAMGKFIPVKLVQKLTGDVATTVKGITKGTGSLLNKTADTIQTVTDEIPVVGKITKPVTKVVDLAGKTVGQVGDLTGNVVEGTGDVVTEVPVVKDLGTDKGLLGALTGLLPTELIKQSLEMLKSVNPLPFLLALPRMFKLAVLFAMLPILIPVIIISIPFFLIVGFFLVIFMIPLGFVAVPMFCGYLIFSFVSRRFAAYKVQKAINNSKRSC